MTKKILFLLLAICPLFVACGSDDNDETPKFTNVDDQAFLQTRLAAEGTLVYGVTIGDDPRDVIARPVESETAALDEFYKLLPTGKNHPGLSAGKGGQVTCSLTDAKGNAQGTITYQPLTASSYCAEVLLSSALAKSTGVSKVNYVLYENWPVDGNGFLKDIMDQLKK